MDLQQILAALLNPSGAQGAPQMAGGPSQVGDHANPALLQQAMMRAQQPQASPPQMQAPQQAPQAQQLPQNAPQAAPAPQQGGLGNAIGGILQGIINPQSAGKNKTVGWLQSQGLDQGTATVLASDKGALRQFIMQRAQGGQAQKPIEINGKLVDPVTYKVIGDYSTPKDREVRNDSNGVPRYVDNGEAVYASDNSSGGGTGFFSGKSVEAQGLNWLIDQGKLTKEQAANVAAGKSVTGPNGEVIFMTPQGIFQQPADGSAPQPVQPGQGGGNIPITGPKYSEDMRKSLGFANRAEASDAIIADPNIAAAGTSLGQNFKSDIPLVGNAMVSQDFQKFDQAQRDFINAVLRRESGAAISPAEFDNARKQYLPQYGDGPEVLQQKAANRKLTIQGLHQSGDAVPSLAGAPPPSQAAPAAPPQKPTQGADAPPASYTGKNWKYLTPEQRKLWQ